MKIQRKPHIHMMDLYNEHYGYDVNTNAIFKISDELAKYLKAVLDSEECNYENLYLCQDAQDGLDYLLSQGLLQPLNDGMEIEHLETSTLENMYDSNLKGIILQVTQNCNLRCKYCVYSGSYVNRQHNNKRMSLDTAKDVIDFFWSHTSKSDNLSFGFYGGEPLLEFDLIKEIVAYINKKFAGKKHTFTITTNATLLGEEQIRFLAENDFQLVISLDGPAEIQNANRVFADGEHGTFESVMSNLRKVKEINEKYYSRISFNAVIDLNQNFSCANDFFLSYDMVKNSGLTGNLVSNTNRKGDMNIKTQFYVDSLYELFKIYLYYANDKDFYSEYKPGLLDASVRSMRTGMYERFISKNLLSSKMTTGGQCLPGIQRFFVNVEGKFYPCERVNENADSLCIGNVKQGFDIGKASEILNVAQLTKNECKKCWCFNMCTQCVSMAEQDGELSATRRLSNCLSVRKNIENEIKNYIVLRNHQARLREEF